VAFQPPTYGLLRHLWFRHYTQQWQTPNCGLPATNVRSTETPVAQTLHSAVADSKLRPSSHQPTVYSDSHGSDTTHSSGRRQTVAFQPPNYGLLRFLWLRHYTQQWQTPNCGLPATNLRSTETLWLRHYTQQRQTPNCGLPATNLGSTETPVFQTLHTAAANAKLWPSSHQPTVY